jgi:hypothetical protein
MQWLEAADDELMHISVITIGEVCKGITVHPEAHRRDWLRQWLENEVRPWFAGRILPVTEAISERWGILEADGLPCRYRKRDLHRRSTCLSRRGISRKDPRADRSP